MGDRNPYGDNRTGTGRWIIVMRPCMGYLWTNDTDSVGFVPVGRVGDTVYDGDFIDSELADKHAAGRTPIEAFDALATAMGNGGIKVGSLDTFKTGSRTRIDKPPSLTTAEVTQAVQEQVGS